MKKQLIALFCAACLCVSCLAACGGSKNKQNLTNADQALADMYATWWMGSATGGNVSPTSSGYYDTNGGMMPWEASQLMSDIYTKWLMEGKPATGDEVDRFTRQWAWTKKKLGNKLTANAGMDAPGPAVDDNAWNAMYYMMTYNVTKDETALNAARDVVVKAYEAFKAAPPGAADNTQNRSTVNGLWYPQHPPSLGFTNLYGHDGDNRWKSLYAAGLVMVGLEFLMIEKQTDVSWQTTYASLWNDTLNVYNWLETNLLRASADTVDAAGPTGSAVTLPKIFENGLQDGSSYTMPATLADNLYWTDYNVDRSGADYWGNQPAEKNGPDGGSRADLWVHEASSFSYLGGGMAMAICHARLYQLTGDAQYLNRAVRTAQAFTDSPNYNNNGVLLNDRDAWNDGFFAGMYVEEVLTLPGIRAADVNMILNTGAAAYQNCRLTLTADMPFKNADNYQYKGKVFYRAEWSGGSNWTKDANSSTQPTQLMTCGSTVNMIMAAAYAQALQLVK
ncbi:MAG: hypothetical protein FWF49_04965 [Oscillospiraceae bacterium]|nr:hypothetical protein [Oscillospiraceae bacterium]